MNNIFKKINFSTRGMILVVIFSLAFFLLGAVKLKTYQSQMTILIIPKSTNAVNQQDKILNNLIELPKTLAFYDRLLKNNPSFVDASAGESALNRKNSWNEMLAVQQVNKNGSMISISVAINSQADAEVIVSKTVRTLLDVTSAYYNIKDDLDLRIVDGPITKVVINRWPWALLASLLLGILLASAVEKILKLEKGAVGVTEVSEGKTFQNFNFFKKIEQPMPIEALENLYKAEGTQNSYDENDLQQAEQVFMEPIMKQDIPAPAEVMHLQEIASRSVYPNFPEMPTHATAKSAAPDNLPIADFGEVVADFPMQDEVVKNELQAEAETAKEKTHEPTEAELRERLNQLLKGEI